MNLELLVDLIVGFDAYILEAFYVNVSGKVLFFGVDCVTCVTLLV
jgi:hypothetical protein